MEAFMEDFMEAHGRYRRFHGKNIGSFHESFRKSFRGNSFHEGLGVGVGSVISSLKTFVEGSLLQFESFGRK